MYNQSMSKNSNPQNFSDRQNYNAPRQPRYRLELPLGARAGGLSYSVAVLINLFVGLIMTGAIMIFSLGGTEAEKYLSLLASPIAIAVLLTLVLKVAKQPARRILPVKTHPKYYLIGLLLIFGLLFSLSSVNEYLIRLFELLGYQRRDPFVPDISGWRVVPVFIVVAIIPPVMEEIFFRGILLQNTEEEVGSLRAVLLVGFCFALYHGSVEQTIYQFICGCVFSFLTVRSRSVLPSVMMHVVNNGLIILFMACGLTDPVTGDIVMSQGAFIAVTVLSALSLIGGLVWLILDKTATKPRQKGSVKTFFIFASVGVGIMALSWILGIFSI